jgi:hypothetical protein
MKIEMPKFTLRQVLSTTVMQFPDTCMALQAREFQSSALQADASSTE